MPKAPADVAEHPTQRTAPAADDFGGLCRYQADNARLPAATRGRVVFFGDSITELWRPFAPDLFTGDVLDRGISGQTSRQMLVRFRADVIDLHPAAVHIMAGTNDIAGNTGPMSLPQIEANIAAMVDMAQAHGVTVILAAIPPAIRFAWRPDLAPAATIVAYNRWLRDYAAQRGLAFVDYHAPLDDGHGGLAASLSGDGVHPNAAGYALMTPKARATVAAALAGRRR